MGASDCNLEQDTVKK